MVEGWNLVIAVASAYIGGMIVGNCRLGAGWNVGFVAAWTMVLAYMFAPSLPG